MQYMMITIEGPLGTAELYRRQNGPTAADRGHATVFARIDLYDGRCDLLTARANDDDALRRMAIEIEDYIDGDHKSDAYEPIQLIAASAIAA
jgi:hypothetical protein